MQTTTLRGCGSCKWWKPYSTWVNRDKLPADSIFKGTCTYGPPAVDPSTKKGILPVTEHILWCGQYITAPDIKVVSFDKTICSFCGEGDKKLAVGASTICSDCIEVAIDLLSKQSL